MGLTTGRWKRNGKKTWICSIRLWYPHFLENGTDDIVSAFILPLSLIGESDTVAEDIWSEGLDIVRAHIVSVFEEGEDLSSSDEGESSTCRGSIGEKGNLRGLEGWRVGGLEG